MNAPIHAPAALNQTTNNYFKVSRWHITENVRRVVHEELFFFDDADPAEVLDAATCAVSCQVDNPGARLSVYKPVRGMDVETIGALIPRTFGRAA